MKRTLAKVFLCLLMVTPAWAGFDKGMAAYDQKDYATALREWRPLAEQGNAAAQYNLGFMYRNGLGVTEDDAEAVRWYRGAAEQGHVDALYKLGLIYRNGHGAPQDYVQAHKWFNLAASKGNKLAVISRDIIAKKMMPADITKAQKLAREWWAAFKKQKPK